MDLAAHVVKPIRIRLNAVFFIALAAVLCVFLMQYSLPYPLPMSQWGSAIFAPDMNSYQQVIVHYSFFPRLTMALLCGAGLAMAGCVMQTVLRNPLASPTTLGVASGAQLGIAIALLLPLQSWTAWSPILSGLASYLTPQWFAFIGGLFATGLVFLLTAKKGFAPLQMVLAGMVVTLFLGALNMVLILFNEQQLTGLFIWGAGALDQNDWQGVAMLWPQLLVAFAILLVIQRPLSIMQLGEEVASSIGIKVAGLRIAALVVSVFITASIVSEVGIISFIGLVAPALAKLLGARKMISQLLLSTLVGALLLLFTDLLVMPYAGIAGDLLPTGAVTALIGAPCLLWLLNQKSWSASQRFEAPSSPHFIDKPFLPVLSMAVVVLVGLFCLSLFVGQTQLGWSATLSATVFDLRMPRIVVAIFAGCALALAGTIIQRITGNPMSSPEVIGISSGAAFSLVLGVLLFGSITRSEQLLLGGAGALSVMFLVWWLSRKSQLSPARMLLTGVALSAFLDSLIRISLASGNDQVKALLAWLSGSTYLVAWPDVSFLVAGTLLLAGLLFTGHRWLDLMALGNVTASAIGVNTYRVRQWLMLLASLLTALAVIVVGPLSFVGLLAPHMAKSLGQYTARHQMLLSCIIGSNIMVLADWLGRNIWFPWQVPAGLLASLIGGGYFIYLLRKEK
ncbi:Fe(3+)-hydroxamate ABC transporter permease FhuB [Vibrio rumoiensis]|uniref:Fe3+-hydroxamate ABC transporter permease FhuB n=1 Tax=Vibrio rumoiensis 1S-45 TaxID=1188252 RepID=A0A1E5DZM4_9VIBR|nr:Fe(3+)-hydroxamate ABC transporter permease FhuB [Vibrio rumoiensis]OEF23393.1 Fe3+-hydroxamate ABC transporter permease FhuB [Vibrio rumoiensis 1S-45]